MNRHQHHSFPRGQTILELIVSIGIIVSCVVTTLGLVIATTMTSNVSKTEILASNLAREGIEIARSIRDDNWLALDSHLAGTTAWNDNLFSGTSPNIQYNAIATFLPDDGTWSLAFGDFSIGSETDATAVYLNPATGVYAQVADTPLLSCPDGPLCHFQPINYWRVISLDPICWSNNPDTGIPDPSTEQIVTDNRDCSEYVGSTQVGVQVRSRVRWLEHGRPHTVDLVDELFDWKP